MSVKPPPNFSVGQQASLSRQITREDIEQMAQLTGDFNPLHIDPERAAKSRFKGRIAHGMFGASLISAVLGTQLPGPGAIYLSQTLEFLAPVRPDDRIIARVEVLCWRSEKKIIELATQCTNQHGKCVLQGKAVLLVEPI